MSKKLSLGEIETPRKLVLAVEVEEIEPGEWTVRISTHSNDLEHKEVATLTTEYPAKIRNLLMTTIDKTYEYMKERKYNEKENG